MRDKVIILELDGATWDVIEPMISRGELPNIKNLKEQGVYGEVNTKYIGSPVIWSAIYSGKVKERLGSVFFGIHRARLKIKRLWEIAAEKDLRVGIFHSLLTWPPAEVDGFIIPGIFAMGPETHPRKYQYIQKLYLSRHLRISILQGYYFLRSFVSCGDWRVAVAFFKFLSSSLFRPQFLNKFRHRLMVVTRLDQNLFLKLYRRYQPHICTFHFHAIDATSHKYWKYMNKSGRYSNVIYDFYREADRCVGKALELVDEHTSLVVLADHGFREDTDARGIFEIKLPVLRKLLSISTTVRLVRFGPAFIMNLGTDASEVEAVRLTEKLASAKLRNGDPLFLDVKALDNNIYFWLTKKILESKAPMKELVSFQGERNLHFGDLFRKKSLVDTGTHAAGRGIFAACGHKLLQNTNIQKVNIFDITPTLLTLLNLPIGKDMDGDLDRRWFKPETLRTIKPSYISSYETEQEGEEKVLAEAYTEGEVEDLEERLKMLGYL